jgi:hypothetical protein
MREKAREVNSIEVYPTKDYTNGSILNKIKKYLNLLIVKLNTAIARNGD